MQPPLVWKWPLHYVCLSKPSNHVGCLEIIKLSFLVMLVFQNSKYVFLSTTWRPPWTRRRCWPPTPMSWATRRRTSTGETFAFWRVFDGTSIFRILFAGHFSTTQRAQSVLKQQEKNFQISRHTLLRMTGASATLRLRWIYQHLFHCQCHQDDLGFALYYRLW